MPAIPIHRSSEQATGLGADPGPDHGKGQPTYRSRAQVGDTGRQTDNLRMKHHPKAPLILQALHSGGSDRVLGCRAGNWLLLCCRGN